jgi:hypothetical protein
VEKGDLQDEAYGFLNAGKLRAAVSLKKTTTMNVRRTVFSIAVKIAGTFPLPACCAPLFTALAKVIRGKDEDYLEEV